VNGVAAEPLLSVEGLGVDFSAPGGRSLRVVDGVTFSLAPGEIVGLVGESGCGKTVTMLSVLRLVPPPGRVSAGRITFAGRDLLALDREAMRSLRGSQISLIPPDATAALNPVLRAGVQVAEGIGSHRSDVTAAQARAQVIEMFRRVGLPNPELRYGRYPHELSGGMQQRALIASALLMSPRLILADEPTTALDVTIQAQILRLLLEVRDDFGTAILYVTHDLGTVAEICDRVLVMYAGHIVESAPVGALFEAPLHPYSRALLRSIPPLSAERVDRLQAIAGAPPDPATWPVGCRFAARCPLRVSLGSPEVCTDVDPPLVEQGPGRHAACHFAGREADVLAAAGVRTLAEAELAPEDEAAQALQPADEGPSAPPTPDEAVEP
jgi:oligopeptide/dipeptide ABC transporter ATP-binding protein